MPFRRKCDDELVPEKIQIPYMRGPLGPVRVCLMGYDPSRPVPFAADDPEGAAWLARSRGRGEEIRQIQKELPKEPRLDMSQLVDRELAEWWDSTSVPCTGKPAEQAQSEAKVLVEKVGNGSEMNGVVNGCGKLTASGR
jgi:hypothetical protein